MEPGKISREAFERMKRKAIEDPTESTGKYGSYRSYFYHKGGSKGIVGYYEYISEADGFPYETVEYECDGS